MKAAFQLSPRVPLHPAQQCSVGRTVGTAESGDTMSRLVDGEMTS